MRIKIVQLFLYLHPEDVRVVVASNKVVLADV